MKVRSASLEAGGPATWSTAGGFAGAATVESDSPPLTAGRPDDRESIDHDVLIAPEVARLLRMNIKTVYELAKAGSLPSWRLGRHFRFSRRVIVARLGQCKVTPYREGK
jgi:excisionase family DNA binding protein